MLSFVLCFLILGASFIGDLENSNDIVNLIFKSSNGSGLRTSVIQMAFSYRRSRRDIKLIRLNSIGFQICLSNILLEKRKICIVNKSIVEEFNTFL